MRTPDVVRTPSHWLVYLDRHCTLSHRRQSSDAAAIWHGDPDLESPEGTSLRDWPTASAFAPLIAAALRVGDMGLVSQLRADQRYCAAMRRKIRRAQAASRQGEAVLRSDETGTGEHSPLT